MLSTVVSPICFAGSAFNFKRQFSFRLITCSNTLMLKTFLSQSKRSYIMTCWPKLNYLNAFVKIDTDALMLCIKSWKNVLKRFSERNGITHKRLFHRLVFTKFSF